MPAAARVLDPHLCPWHAGGPILGPGCPTVLIGGMPAARLGDLATCPGPPAPIVMGEPTVLIGGMPAARMGDFTGHGGAIAFGLPTVMIGPTPQGVVLRTAAGAGAAFAEVCPQK